MIFRTIGNMILELWTIEDEKIDRKFFKKILDEVQRDSRRWRRNLPMINTHTHTQKHKYTHIHTDK